MNPRFKHLAKKYYYDKEKAEYVREWLKNRIKHVQGEWAGRPFELLDFQWDDIVQPIFGLYEKKGGNRLINEAYIEIPKKNGKTTLFAALENFLLFADGEPGAEIYNCAGDDEQANLLFRTAKNMVISDSILKTHSRQLRTEIFYKTSIVKKLTSKADTKHGLNAHAVFMDELHAQQDPELYETLKYAGAQRRNPIFAQITTAGYDKLSICWDRHEYARKVNEGVIEDDHFWGVIYSAKETSEDDYYFDEKVWAEANPMWNYSETFRRMFKRDAQKAKNNNSELNAFKRLRLNIWTGSEEKWLSDEDWMKGNKPIPDLTGRTAYLGVDLAAVSDTCAVVAVIPFDDKYYLDTYIFVPEEQINKRDQRNEMFYREWAKNGYLIRTHSNTTDYGEIKKKIIELGKKYNIKTIGFDPWNAADLMSSLNSEHGLEVVEYRQGFATMSKPSKEFERLLMDGNLIHGGHPVLRWMADNAQLIRDNNDNYRVAKGKVSKDKVDGIIAAIIGVGEAVRFREKEKSFKPFLLQ